MLFTPPISAVLRPHNMPNMQIHQYQPAPSAGQFPTPPVSVLPPQAPMHSAPPSSSPGPPPTSSSPPPRLPSSSPSPRLRTPSPPHLPLPPPLLPLPPPRLPLPPPPLPLPPPPPQPAAQIPVPIARQPFSIERYGPVHYLGPMDKICPFCHALHWKTERLTKSSDTSPKFGLCCFSGKVVLPLLTRPPIELWNLYVGDDTQSKRFRQNIRKYNNALAMTSVGVDRQKPPGRGPPVWVIQGALHHKIGTLLPMDGNQPTFAQLYIYDPTSITDMAMRNPLNNRLDIATMATLHDMLYRNNQLTHIYKKALELTNNVPADQRQQVILHLDPTTDRRRYNLPVAENELALILPGDGDIHTDPRDIVIRKQGGGLQRISELSPLYQPLHYVLLFPYGEPGWHNGMKLNVDHDNEPAQNNADNEPVQNDSDGEAMQQTPKKRTKLSLIEYTAFRLHPRLNESNHIFRAGMLFQEFMVDMWAAAEQERLRWIENNQKDLRADAYHTLASSVAQTQ